MDTHTPVKSSVAAASNSSPNPVSQFEDSPIFKYINNLSPIKPLNQVQSFNLLSYASPKSSNTSPTTNCLQNSKKTCSPLSYSLKPELADGEKEVRETQVSDNGYMESSFGVNKKGTYEPAKSVVDAYQSSGDDPGISLTQTDHQQVHQDSVVVKEESATDEPTALSTEPPQFSSMDHGVCDFKDGDVTNSVSQAVDSEISSEFFIQNNAESSFSNDLALQGVQLDKMKGHGRRWGEMLVEAADQLLCNSPFEEVGFEETGCVDSETLSFMENVLQPSEESIDDILNLESPLGSFEEYDVNVPYAYPNAAEKDSEKGQASACAPVVDEAVPDSHAELYNTPYLEPYQILPRRCLVYEVSGTSYKKVVSEASETSLFSEQSACTAITSEKRLVSSKREVYNCSPVLPGIGLHLNAFARSEKIIVKQEVSTYKRQLITIPCTTSFLHSAYSDAKPSDSVLDIDTMQKELEPSNSTGKLNEDACRSLAVTRSEEFKQNLTKRKRCKSELVEGDTCKRCNCKRSKCLKLYCECFAAGLYCVDPCSCQGCLNKPAFEGAVLETRRLIESRNPLAFAPKVIRLANNASESRDELHKTPASARHKRGCNCKKSSCLKKYCECFQGGVGCSLRCRCEGCRNSFGQKYEHDNLLLEVIEATHNNSADVDFQEDVLNVDKEDPQETPSSQISRLSILCNCKFATHSSTQHYTSYFIISSMFNLSDPFHFFSSSSGIHLA
ncbi:hypothetical protein V2J09_001110 [Rumex salicifolius]